MPPQTPQACYIFDELFVKRTPLSEACRGVITSLGELGLGEMLTRAARGVASPERRLDELRAWFASQSAEEHLERVFQTAGLRYAVMTNVPFAPEEAEHFFLGPGSAPAPPISPRLKTALRVDPLLSGHWPAVSAALAAASPPYEQSLAGAYAYVRDWVSRIDPLYLMASTPAGFRYTRTRPGAALPEHGAEPLPSELLEQVAAKHCARAQPNTARELNPYTPSCSHLSTCRLSTPTAAGTTPPHAPQATLQTHPHPTPTPPSRPSPTLPHPF